MQSLRTLAKKCNFTIGAAVTKQDNFYTDPTYRQLLADHFNLCVPANSMKCSYVCAKPNQYDFEQTDILIDFALQHHQAVRGHALCWTHSLRLG